MREVVALVSRPTDFHLRIYLHFRGCGNQLLGGICWTRGLNSKLSVQAWKGVTARMLGGLQNI
jgi:hypothetical protein